mmetsp:Transcript_21994/g.39254  ORF Transcript_21994/g.39254 Transcript_21994/m.39254 type:complete len:104 (-) Transcript_21994:186-497(-)|eukprot:CAMPEP_0177773850 /NCGR_PEP_ID=MMETSP0491_2-20121128/13134_1 /TAXON_ID=63592 /ORGANISM="Tetraselmis chuii, Strain PLY429" /LENGTH=103 /DNA_ID=CAMNT_0019292071 /DNA_START=290 /DNA_END=601 /DNA_ORIENTATION=+
MVLKTVGDPRRPAEARQYEPPQINPEEQTPDAMSLIALVFGLGAVTLKIKACSWISLFCCVSSICTTKTSSMDPKQIMTSFMFAIFGLVSSYLTPQMKPRAPQ